MDWGGGRLRCTGAGGGGVVRRVAGGDNDEMNDEEMEERRAGCEWTVTAEEVERPERTGGKCSG